jgi:hypothetical protein
MGPHLKSALSIEEGRPSHERVMRYTGSRQNLTCIFAGRASAMTRRRGSPWSDLPFPGLTDLHIFWAMACMGILDDNDGNSTRHTT